MRKNSSSNMHSGAYTSPGTPDYHYNDVGQTPKYWSSERVPLPTNSISRRHISAAALLPFNSGRTLPSKWDDAERWITSPVSAHGSFSSPVAQTQRRPMSKSGPISPPALVNARNYMVNSPLATGVLIPEGLSIHYNGGKSDSFYVESHRNADTSASDSVVENSDSIVENSAQSSQDDKTDGVEEEGARVVCSRDMATQMSPGGSARSSSRGRLSFSALSSSFRNSSWSFSKRSGRHEVRDVEVDRGITTSRPSKKQGLKKMTKCLTNVGESHLPWDRLETSKRSSRLQREEAKITAWENLQKAKAEAAIQILEMKLEKKRSSSMDKIMNKLRAAETRAQSMRDSLSENPTNRGPARSRIGVSCCIRVKARSVSNFFRFRRN